jgi:predicted RNA-binding Zn-ribbon protein involved in translation (DUF1610 family)
MTTNAQACANCGASLSLQDLTRPNCPYCGQVLPHHARAAEHAALVNQVLAQQVQANSPWLGAGAAPQIPYEHGAPLPHNQQFAAYAAASNQVNKVLARTSKIALLVVLASALAVTALAVGIVVLVLVL